MGKPKRAAPQKERKLSFINVCKSDSDGKPVFKASVVTDDKQLVVLGVFTSAKDAAKAADLATLALKRRGPLNFLKNIYLQRDVKKEKERLRKLGLLVRNPSRRKAAHLPCWQEQPKQNDLAGQPKQERMSRHKSNDKQELAEDDQTLWPAAEAEQLVAGGSKASRKRKAAGPSTDITAAASSCEGDQQHPQAAAAEGRPKRRKVQQAAQGSPVCEAVPHLPARKQRSRLQSPAAELELADAAEPVSTDLVPAAPGAALLATAGAVQLAPPGADNHEALLQQLRSALAAHEVSKQQLRAALNALEVSEGQLAAVAGAAGLQL